VIHAVLFDLDDTLFDQRQWLDGAWRAVAARAGAWGLDPDALLRALREQAAAGSDRGGIIDRALAQVGAAGTPVAPILDAFQTYTPTRLEPYRGVAAALEQLAARVPLGLVSDGEPGVQLAKLAALGLAPCFSTVVLSDQYGRAHRKPDPLPFRRALADLDVDADDAVFVGDRPAKDVAGPVALGMRAIRVRTGEWRTIPDDPRAWLSVDSVLDAVVLIERELEGSPSRPRVTSGG
jgi:putative hydrolase of the HAD superfamily